MYNQLVHKLLQEKLFNCLIHQVNNQKQAAGIKPLSYSVEVKREKPNRARIIKTNHHSVQSKDITYRSQKHKQNKLKPLTNNLKKLSVTLEPKKSIINIEKSSQVNQNDLQELFLRLSKIETADAIDIQSRLYPNTVQYVKITKQQVLQYLNFKFSLRISQKIIKLLKLPQVISYIQFIKQIDSLKNLSIVQSIKFVFYILDINDNLQITTKELLQLLEESKFNDFIDQDIKFIINRCRNKFNDQKNELPAPKLRVLNLKDSYRITEPNQIVRVKKDTLYTKLFTSDDEEESEQDNNNKVKIITNQTFFLGVDEFVQMWYPYIPRIYSEIVNYFN